MLGAVIQRAIVCLRNRFCPERYRFANPLSSSGLEGVSPITAFPTSD